MRRWRSSRVGKEKRGRGVGVRLFSSRRSAIKQAFSAVFGRRKAVSVSDRL